MKEILEKIKASFHAASNGKEDIKIVIWYWGVIAYLASYFVVNKLIQVINFRFFDIVISLLMVIYFIWHIYAVRKCAPKKPKLNKEEQQRIREEKRKNLGKSLMKKLLLQESFTKWDTITAVTVADALCVAHFLSYIIG